MLSTGVLRGSRDEVKHDLSAQLISAPRGCGFGSE